MKKGFIQVLPLLLLAAFAVVTLVIANRVQTQQEEIRSRAFVPQCEAGEPNCRNGRIVPVITRAPTAATTPRAPYCARTCSGNYYCVPDTSGGHCVQEVIRTTAAPPQPTQQAAAPQAPAPAPARCTYSCVARIECIDAQGTFQSGGCSVAGQLCCKFPGTTPAPTRCTSPGQCLNGQLCVIAGGSILPIGAGCTEPKPSITIAPKAPTQAPSITDLQKTACDTCRVNSSVPTVVCDFLCSGVTPSKYRLSITSASDGELNAGCGGPFATGDYDSEQACSAALSAKVASYRVFYYFNSTANPPTCVSYHGTGGLSQSDCAGKVAAASKGKYRLSITPTSTGELNAGCGGPFADGPYNTIEDCEKALNEAVAKYPVYYYIDRNTSPPKCVPYHGTAGLTPNECSARLLSAVAHYSIEFNFDTEGGGPVTGRCVANISSSLTLAQCQQQLNDALGQYAYERCLKTQPASRCQGYLSTPNVPPAQPDYAFDSSLASQGKYPCIALPLGTKGLTLPDCIGGWNQFQGKQPSGLCTCGSFSAGQTTCANSTTIQTCSCGQTQGSWVPNACTGNSQCGGTPGSAKCTTSTCGSGLNCSGLFLTGATLCQQETGGQAYCCPSGLLISGNACTAPAAVPSGPPTLLILNPGQVCSAVGNQQCVCNGINISAGQTCSASTAAPTPTPAPTAGFLLPGTPCGDGLIVGRPSCKDACLSHKTDWTYIFDPRCANIANLTPVAPIKVADGKPCIAGQGIVLGVTASCNDCSNGFFPTNTKSGEFATCGPVGSTPPPKNPGGFPNDTDCWSGAIQATSGDQKPLPLCDNCADGYHGAKYFNGPAKCGPEAPPAGPTAAPAATITPVPPAGPQGGTNCIAQCGIFNLACIARTCFGIPVGPAPSVTPTPPSAGGVPAAGSCTYYSCSQQLVYTAGGARQLKPGFCPTNYPKTNPCNLTGTIAPSQPTNTPVPAGKQGIDGTECFGTVGSQAANDTRPDCGTCINKPNGPAPDGHYYCGGRIISETKESGCCTTNDQCEGWFGKGTVCDNLNGACASGIQCRSAGAAAAWQTPVNLCHSNGDASDSLSCIYCSGDAQDHQLGTDNRLYCTNGFVAGKGVTQPQTYTECLKSYSKLYCDELFKLAPRAGAGGVQPVEGQVCSQSHGTQVGNLYCCNGKFTTQCLINGDWCRSNTYPLTGLTHPYCDGACPGGISHWESVPDSLGVQAPKCGPEPGAATQSAASGIRYAYNTFTDHCDEVKADSSLYSYANTLAECQQAQQIARAAAAKKTGGGGAAPTGAQPTAGVPVSGGAPSGGQAPSAPSAPGATPTPAPMTGPGKCAINPVRYPVEGAGWCDAKGVRCVFQNGQVAQLADPWCDIDGAIPANTCSALDQRSIILAFGCTLSQRTTVPDNSALLNNGIGLTNGAAMSAGNFQVEGFCNSQGYGVNHDNNDWFCLSSNGTPAFTLKIADYDKICQQTYQNYGAFAIQSSTSTTPAFNWRCYAFTQ